MDFRGWVNSLSKDQKDFYARVLTERSYSQNFQDIFALWVWGQSYAPSFVCIDIGAADGLNGSNTLKFAYSAECYLIEPNPEQFKKLEENRPNELLNMFPVAIWDRTATVQFHATEELDLSTIQFYGQNDEHAAKRERFRTVEVQAITLADFMEENQLENVTYISLDTEGSEYDILKAYFADERSKRNRIDSFTVEHNYTENRQKIYDLMIANGYRRVFEEVSKWDDFYVRT